MVKPIIFLLFAVFPVGLFKGLLAIAGWFLVPIGLIGAKRSDDIPKYPSRVPHPGWQYVPLSIKWIDAVWGSYKYGAEGNWIQYGKYGYSGVKEFWPRYEWLAFRNAISNAPFVFKFLKLWYVDHTKIKTYKWNGFTLCIYGNVAGLFWRDFKWGYKLNPNEDNNPTLAFIK